MDTIEAIRKLQESLERNGNLPVIVYKDTSNFYEPERYEVSAVNPCSNADHLLIVTGDRER